VPCTGRVKDIKIFTQSHNNLRAYVAVNGQRIVNGGFLVGSVTSGTTAPLPEVIIPIPDDVWDRQVNEGDKIKVDLTSLANTRLYYTEVLKSDTVSPRPPRVSIDLVCSQEVSNASPDESEVYRDSQFYGNDQDVPCTGRVKDIKIFTQSHNNLRAYVAVNGQRIVNGGFLVGSVTSGTTAPLPEVIIPIPDDVWDRQVNEGDKIKVDLTSLANTRLYYTEVLKSDTVSPRPPRVEFTLECAQIPFTLDCSGGEFDGSRTGLQCTHFPDRCPVPAEANGYPLPIKFKDEYPICWSATSNNNYLRHPRCSDFYGKKDPNNAQVVVSPDFRYENIDAANGATLQDCVAIGNSADQGGNDFNWVKSITSDVRPAGCWTQVRETRWNTLSVSQIDRSYLARGHGLCFKKYTANWVPVRAAACPVCGPAPATIDYECRQNGEPNGDLWEDWICEWEQGYPFTDEQKQAADERNACPSVPDCATCDSFSCSHSSLNKGSGVSCTGGANTCNAETCCDSQATCASFNGCSDASLNKGSGVSCAGDAGTCNAETCCDSRATCDSFNGCSDASLNKGSGVSCTGDTGTCNAETCCDSQANCGDDFSCPDNQYYSVNLGRSVLCAGDADTCTIDRCCEGQRCGFQEWGTGIPFATGTKVNLDGSNPADILIDFTFSTPSCVDRKNWLGLTLHGTLNPICEGKTDDDNQACSAYTDDETACKLDTDCRYRIPCKTEELVGSDIAPFDVNKGTLVTTTAVKQDTKFSINIDTSKLGAANNVYSEPTQTTDAKLEFCARPAVVVAQTTVLYRELVLRAEIDMEGSFQDLQVAADSFQADSVQEVDNSISITADVFACSAEAGNVYRKLQGDVTLTPNQVFTLCVVPSSASTKCGSILTLNFAQDRSNAGGLPTFNEDRIAGGTPANFLLTAVPTTGDVRVEKDGQITTLSGCVVNSRLESAYFVATTPNAISISGSALLDFVSTSGRRLREKSVQSSTAVSAFGKRNLQEEQIASFDMQVQLSNDQVENNSLEVDAAECVDAYLATAFAIAAASYVV